MKFNKIITLAIILFLVNIPLISALNITDVNSTDIKVDSATIKWVTDNESDSTVFYGLTSELGLNKTNSTLLTNHSVLLTDLSSSSDYYFAVESKNAAGNKSYDNNGGSYYQFKTIEESELKLNITNKKRFVNNNKYYIEGTATPNSKVQFSINNRLQSIIEETGLNYLIVNDSGKFSGTIRLIDNLNNITVFVSDDKGNRESLKHYVTLDRTAPKLILNQIKTPRNNRTIPVKGLINENSSLKAVLVFDNKTIYDQEIDVINKSFNTNIDLNKDGKYVLNLTATDLAGNNVSVIKIIILDTKKPKIDLTTDFKQDFHFSYFDFEGKTEPNSRIWIINTGNNSKIVVNVTQYDKEYKTIEGGFKFDALAPFIKYSKEIRANSAGDFKEKLLLEEGKNEIIIKVVDEAGNQGADIRRTATLKSGSDKWKIGKISTIPNEVYTSSMKVGKTSMSIMFDLYYLGGSADEIKNLVPRGMSVSPDGGNRRANNSFISKIDDASIWYIKDEGKFVGYAKIILDQYTDDPYKLPDQLDFDLDAVLGYKIDNIPQSDLIYLKTAVSVQKPLKYSKWLTPAMINKSIKRLDKWIVKLDKGISAAKKLTTATTGVCLALIVGRYLGLVEDNTVFFFCDRVGCPPVPPKCASLDQIKGTNYFKGSLDDGSDVTVEFLSDKQKQGINVRCSGDKPNVIETTYSRPNDIVSNVATKVLSAATQPTTIISEGGKISTVSSNYGCTNMSKKDFLSNPLTLGGRCYNPTRDKTKCLDQSVRGANPFDDLFTSARCGCFTGVWGNLENLRKILFGMKQCLKQAQIGNIRGGYCERLFAQYSCDFIQWGLKFLTGSINVGKSAETSDGDSFKKRYTDINNKLQERYQGTLQSRFGLTSNQLVHKACVGAITGDWSTLREDMLSQVKAPVAPIIGPMMPESRIVGYNPFTGELSIQYLMSIGIMSGGQEVTAKLNLYCKPGDLNDYCPEDRVLQHYSQPITFYVPKDGTIQRNHIINVENSRYWLNEAELIVEYNVGQERKTKTLREPIIKKGEMAVQCHWQMIPPMIVCDKLGQNLYGTIQLVSAKRSPEVSVYYPDQDVNLKINLAKIGNFDFNTRNVYLYWKLNKPDGNEEKHAVKIDDVKDVDTLNYTLFKFTKENKDILKSYSKEFKQNKIKIKKSKFLYIVAGNKDKDSFDRKEITSLYINGKDDQTCNPVSEFMYKCDNNKDIDISKITLTVKTGAPVDVYYYYKTDASDFEWQGSSDLFKPWFTINVLSTEKIKKYPSGTYQLTVDLYEDVNKDGSIDPLYDKKITYEAKNQTKLLSPRFRYTESRPDCEAKPIVDIIKPIEGYYSKKDPVDIEVNVWDDCNQVTELNVTAVDKFGRVCKSEEDKTISLIDLGDCESGNIKLKIKAKDKTNYGQYAEVDIVKNKEGVDSGRSITSTQKLPGGE